MSVDYYIHCTLSGKLAERVLSIEKKYQGNSRSRPHLTIIRPQGISADVSERELIGSIGFALRKQKPLLIIQLGVGYFGEKEIVCIKVKRSVALMLCHRRLTKATIGLLDGSRGEFAHLPNPHITLAARLSGESAKKAWASLKDQDFSGRFLCKRVSLLRKREGDKRWKVIKDFNLDG